MPINFNATVSTTQITFFGDSVLGETGVINGNAIFRDSSKNLGTVNGTGLFFDSSSNGDASLQTFDPPLKCTWVTSSGKRRLVCLGSKNQEQLAETIFGGPWLKCPDDGCFAYPALYRPAATVSYVIDYDDKPNYLSYPGNPEPV